MRTLVKNQRLTILIRIVLAVVLLLLAGALAIRLYGKAKLDKAYKDAESAWRNEAPSSPAKSLGEKDAIVWLAAGGRAAVLEGDARDTLADLSSALKQPNLSEKEIHRAETLLAINAPAMELLNRAQGLEASATPLFSPGGDWWKYETSKFTQSITTSRLLALEARLGWRRGDWNRFFNSARLLAIWSQALESDPSSQSESNASMWLGTASEGLLTAALREATQSPSFPLADARDLLGLLPNTDFLALWRTSLHAQVKLVDDPNHNQLDAGILFEASRPEAFLDNLLFGDWTRANLIQFNAALAKASGKPYAEKVTDIPAGFYAPSLRGNVWQMENIEAGSLARLQGTLAQRQLARASLEALAARQRLGHWPEASALPLGPDPFTGNPLRYEIMSDGALRLSCPGLAALCATSPRNRGFKIADTWTLPATK